MKTSQIKDDEYKALIITDGEGKEFEDIISHSFKEYEKVIRLNLSGNLESERKKIKEIMDMNFNFVCILTKKKISENVASIFPTDLVSFIESKGTEAERKKINKEDYKRGYLITSIESINEPYEPFDVNKIINKDKRLNPDSEPKIIKYEDPYENHRCSCCGELSWGGKALRCKLTGVWG